MANSALFEAVQQKAAATIAATWADAQAEAERCQAEADRSIEQHRDQHAARLREVTAAAARQARLDAARRVLIIRSEARAALADRLRAAATEALARLRDAAYPERFAALAGELPVRDWARLAVHPDDAALAQARFPGRDIRGDAAVMGGVIAEDDVLRVDNTFERRLAAAWPELLPAVMKDVIQLHQRSHPAA